MRFCYSCPTPCKTIWIMVVGCLLLFSGLTPAEEPRAGAPKGRGPDRIPDESHRPVLDLRDRPTQSLGRVQVDLAGPGVSIGNTWYDYQHNGAMGRMIDWSYTATDGFIVHFSWMDALDNGFVDRRYGYNAYRASDGSFLGPTLVQPASGHRGGYVGIDANNSGRAIVGGHNTTDWNRSHFFYQDTAGQASFDTSSYVTDSVANYPIPIPDPFMTRIWPKFRYIESFDDTLIHVVAKTHAGTDPANPQPFYYFRKVG